MADLAEILMTEHLAIRHLRKSFTVTEDIDLFRDFHLYVKECHIEIEEKLLFPVLEAHNWEDSDEFSFKAEQIKADHRLLETLSENLLKWHEKGSTITFGQRFPLYFKLLVEHNSREEDYVFPRWAGITEDELKGTVKEAENIIKSFGKTEYLNITGMSEKAFEYIFR